MTDTVRDHAATDAYAPSSTRGIVLLIAYHFPPENTVGAARPYRFYKYLPSFGFDCFVITAADTSSRPELAAQYVPDPLVQNMNTGLGWQIERAVRKFFLPGAIGLRWCIYAYRAAWNFIAANPGRRITVVSTYPPLSTNLAAYLLSRRGNVRWVADYRDQMADNAAQSNFGSFQQAVVRYIEKILVNRADVTIANTDSAQDRLKRLYPKRANRIELIWNGFDPEKRLTPSSVSGRGCRIVSHIGSLYGDRTITDVLDSIQRLIADGRLDPSAFRVQLVGDMEPGCVPDESFLRSASQAGWLTVVNRRLPQEEAQKLMCESDSLILVLPYSTVQVPAKLYEYVQIGRPILAHVVKGSPAERILAHSGVPYTCVYSSQSRDDFDTSVLNFFKQPLRTVSPSEYFERTFNGKSQVEALAGMIETLSK